VWGKSSAGTTDARAVVNGAARGGKGSTLQRVLQQSFGVTAQDWLAEDPAGTIGHPRFGP